MFLSENGGTIPFEDKILNAMTGTKSLTGYISTQLLYSSYNYFIITAKSMKKISEQRHKHVVWSWGLTDKLGG